MWLTPLASVKLDKFCRFSAMVLVVATLDMQMFGFRAKCLGAQVQRFDGRKEAIFRGFLFLGKSEEVSIAALALGHQDVSFSSSLGPISSDSIPSLSGVHCSAVKSQFGSRNRHGTTQTNCGKISQPRLPARFWQKVNSESSIATILVTKEKGHDERKRPRFFCSNEFEFMKSSRDFSYMNQRIPVCGCWGRYHILRDSSAEIAFERRRWFPTWTRKRRRRKKSSFSSEIHRWKLQKKLQKKIPKHGI